MITNIMRRLACSKPTQTHMSLRLTKGYENITPSPTPPIEGGEHTPSPLSRGDFPSPLVREGKGEGVFSG